MDFLIGTAQENSPDGILVVDEAGQIVTFNQKFADVWNIPSEIVDLGDDAPVLKSAVERTADPAAFLARVKYLYEQKTEKSHEEILLKDGRTLDRYSAPMFDQDNEYLGRVWYFRDITRFKQTEAALRVSEERLKLAAASGRIGIWEYNLQTGDLIWDDTMFALYGARREDFSGAYEAWTSRVHPDDLAANEAALQDAIDGIRVYAPEFRVLLPDGDVRYIKGHAQVIRDEAGNPIRVIGTNWDNWAFAETQQQLQLANTAINQSKTAYFWINLEGKVHSANDFACQSLGYDRNELLGMCVWDFDPDFTPVDLQLFLAGMRQHGKRVIETHHRRRDGTIFPVEVTADLISYHGEENIFCTVRDITERKVREQEIHQLNTELERRVEDRTIKLELANRELESFSYSVSHDLRAPLRSIASFGSILVEDYGPGLDDEGNRLLQVVCDEAARMGRLIDDLLEFSRTKNLAFKVEKCDMTQLAQCVFDSLDESLRGHVQQFNLRPLPPAEGDTAMLRQVLFNLLANAAKFSGRVKNAVIEVGATTGEEMNTYYVKDNGAGFDQRYAHKLFGVFQRLHGEDEFEGTGVGLALAQRIIMRHGGKVWAEGRLDAGATFYFTLPIKKER